MNSRIILSYIKLQYKMLFRTKRTSNIIALSIFAPLAYGNILSINDATEIVLTFSYMLPYIFYSPLAFSWDSSFFGSIVLLPINKKELIVSKLMIPILLNLVILLLTLPFLFFSKTADIAFIVSANVFFMGLYSFIGILFATKNRKYIDLSSNRSKSFNNFAIIDFLLVLLYILLYAIPVFIFKIVDIFNIIPLFFIFLGIISFGLSKFWINIINKSFSQISMLKYFTNDKN